MDGYDFSTPSLGEFLDLLSSDSPTPGGGTGAALSGAMGAALVRMLAVLTIGRKKYAAHEDLMKAVAENAAAEKDRLLALAAQDAEAYDAVSSALRMPKEDDEQVRARKEAMQAALRQACDVPLAVMERCLEVISLARQAVTCGNRNAASDGAAGAELARAGLKIASWNVKINLLSLEDEAYATSARTRMDEMTYMGMRAAAAVDSQVEEMLRPKGGGAAR